MNNPLKTMFLVGVGIVGGSAVLVKVIKNNRTKIKAAFYAAIDAWLKTEEVEEAAVVSTSPLDELKPNVVA